MSENTAHSPRLAKQLRLIEDRRADVADLLEQGGPHDEALLDLVANDLVGARLVIRAALLAPPPRAVFGEAREDLERLEREAAALLGVVLDVLGAGWRSGAGRGQRG
ncbi:hypothetical protein GBA65_21975 (plasmid) [Rubrobacter marinus]|uniref:Uncharacterized protein n=1 Tax=Rubrobacter marinus TaxID=2653852 RepID=A0A6G8Q3S3_9ACTN|nr:hypothetical protein [Rubrobacter marinus]QIN81105.1 hypothetical protein GBA65_21975 [Rubrobacter marinus]